MAACMCSDPSECVTCVRRSLGEHIIELNNERSMEVAKVQALEAEVQHLKDELIRQAKNPAMGLQVSDLRDALKDIRDACPPYHHGCCSIQREMAIQALKDPDSKERCLVPVCGDPVPHEGSTWYGCQNWRPCPDHEEVSDGS